VTRATDATTVRWFVTWVMTVLHYTPRDLGRRQLEMAKEIRKLLAVG
jgi:hypothetical protein